MVENEMTRREFVRATAAAGAGLVLAANTTARAQNKPANSKINIALIGFGAQGRVLLESLLKIEGIQLVAICDIWEAARATTAAPNFFKRYRHRPAGSCQRGVHR